MSEVEGPDMRGRPLVEWENRVDDYMRERGTEDLDQARRECWNRVNWRNFPLHPPPDNFLITMSGEGCQNICSGDLCPY